MKATRLSELRAWNKAQGLLRSEVDELLDSVEKENKEIHGLRIAEAAGDWWYERAHERPIEFSTKYAGLFSIFLILRRLDIYIHLLPIPKPRDEYKFGWWKMWGYREEWYDGPHPSFHLGPFLMISWEYPQYGKPSRIREINSK